MQGFSPTGKIFVGFGSKFNILIEWPIFSELDII